MIAFLLSICRVSFRRTTRSNSHGETLASPRAQQRKPMRVRKATHLALTLLVAAGMGVGGAAVKAQGTTSFKIAVAKDRLQDYAPR